MSEETTQETAQEAPSSLLQELRRHHMATLRREVAELILNAASATGVSPERVVDTVIKTLRQQGLPEPETFREEALTAVASLLEERTR